MHEDRVHTQLCIQYRAHLCSNIWGQAFWGSKLTLSWCQPAQPFSVQLLQMSTHTRSFPAHSWDFEFIQVNRTWPEAIPLVEQHMVTRALLSVYWFSETHIRHHQSVKHVTQSSGTQIHFNVLTYSSSCVDATSSITGWDGSHWGFPLGWVCTQMKFCVTLCLSGLDGSVVVCPCGRSEEPNTHACLWGNWH